MVAMQCYYGCCKYTTRQQVQVQQLQSQCHYGCCTYTRTQPYPTYMVTNQHHTPTSADDGVLRINKRYRVPMMPIPQPPDTIDLKITGPSIETETVVLWHWHWTLIYIPDVIETLEHYNDCNITTIELFIDYNLNFWLIMLFVLYVTFELIILHGLYVHVYFMTCRKSWSVNRNYQE